MTAMKAAGKQTTATALRTPGLRRALLGRARRTGRSVVLLWHRVGPTGPMSTEVVRTVPTSLFREQLRAVADVFDVVPLTELDQGGGRPRVALTFDDDYACHARDTLPVLAELGLPATFFLCGRWLQGLGRYWWEVLEHRIAARGLPTVAEELGVPAHSPSRLAAAVTGTRIAEELAREGDGTPGDLLDESGARALVDAGMEIGFHTLRHPDLTALDDAAVATALTTGRADLAGVVGQPLGQFAYPHGRADARVAGQAVAAGYTAAWTTSKQATGPTSDPHLRSRWEPGRRPPAEVVAGIYSRLVRDPVSH